MRNYSVQKKASSGVGILMKLIVSAIFIFPFLWMISLALQTDQEIARLTFIPSSPTLENFARAWKLAPFGKYFRNSIVIIISVIVLQTVVMVPAAYAFAKFDFRGKGVLFGIILIAFMMPIQVTFIPIYYMMADFGWTNTLLPQIIPSMTNAFGIFLLRQYFMQVPDELIEAARLDNASEVQVLARIMLPMSKPGISAIALLSFIGHWNDYFWPLIMTNSDEVRPISIGVQRLKDTEGNDQWNVIMAGNMFLVGPILIMYLFCSKYIINSFAYSGIK
ncbi:MAG: carbohydrate ABC transporter permease [Candidatus Faecivicinus sp.]